MPEAKHANYSSQVEAVELDKALTVDGDPTATKRRRFVLDENDQTEHLAKGRNFESSSTNMFKRDGTFITQTDALDELKVISQAEGIPLADTKGYKYDDKAGEGIWIYVIDTGANKDHPVRRCFARTQKYADPLQEYKDAPGQKEWIIFPGQLSAQRDTNGHGSCVLSKVNGPTYGVAKKSNVVIAKVSGVPADDSVTVTNLLKGYRNVLNDILNKGRKGKAVVNVSKNIPGNLFTSLPGSRQAFRDIVLKFMQNDVVFVAASGNDGNKVRCSRIGLTKPLIDLPLQPLHENVDGYPALFANSGPVIVVGSVDKNGKKSWFSQGGPLVSVHAPGEDITCARNTGTGTTQQTGTSLCMYYAESSRALQSSAMLCRALTHNSLSCRCRLGGVLTVT